MKTVHFSIDDCIISLKELTENVHKYNSIFDNSFFNALKALHDVYGAVFSLYIWEEKSGFNISQVTNVYKSEFESCKKWLKFGFHGSAKFDYLNGENGGRTLAGFIEAYKNAVNSIEHFASTSVLTNTIRLHRYIASKEEIDFLLKENIHFLLSAHDNRISYDLSAAKNEILKQDGMLLTNTMNYIQSDYCIELMDNIKPVISHIHKNSNITLFTHEKNFLQEYEKIEYVFKRLLKNRYTFVNDIF